MLGDFRNTYLHTRRGWFYLLSNQANDVDDFTEVLPEFLILFQVSGQSQRAAAALGLVRQAAYAMAATRPYHLLKLLAAEVTVQGALGNAEGVLTASRDAMKVLGQLQVEPAMSILLSLSLLSTQVAACVAVGTVACDAGIPARELTEALEKLAQKEPKALASPLLHYPAATLAFFHAYAGKLPPPIVREILTTTIDPSVGSGDPTHSATSIGRAFLALIEGEDSARVDLANAARAMLSALRARQAANPLEAAPLRLDESLAVQAVVASLSSKGELTTQDASLLFELVNLRNRTWRSVESQYGYAVSLLQSEDARLSLQAYYNLEQTLAVEERSAINALSDIVEGKTVLKKPKLDADRLMKFSDLDRLQEQHSGVVELVSSAFAREGRDLLAEVQAHLDPNERFITHAVSFGRVVRVCVGRSSFHVSSSLRDPTREMLAVKTLLAALTNPSPPSASLDAQFPREQAAYLSELVLGSGTACLGEAERLIAAPDPIFFRLPMHVLLDPSERRPSAALGVSELPWLGMSRAISLVTDPRQFLAARALSHRAPAALAFLGVGDPSLAATTEQEASHTRVALRGPTGSRLASLTELERLPQTRSEIARMAARFGPSAKVLLGGDATELKIRSQPLSDYRVISFATHGLTREEVLGVSEPALVVTPRNSSIPSNDGLLTASEISQFSLSADVVILSACNTAQFDPGALTNEAVGLSTAFLLAGARATVASMWSVDTRATALLMESFAESLASDPRLGAAEALRAAMARFRARYGTYAHPRFWAAFSVFGDGAPRSTAAPSSHARFLPISDKHLRQTWGDSNGIAELTDGTRVWSGFEDTGRARLRGLLRVQPPNSRWFEYGDDNFSFVVPAGRHLEKLTALAWRAPKPNALEMELRTFDSQARLKSRHFIDGLGDSFGAGIVALDDERFIVASTKGFLEKGGVQVSIRLVDDRGTLKRVLQKAIATELQVSEAYLQPSGRGGAWLVVRGSVGGYTLGPPTRVGTNAVCAPSVKSLLFHVSPRLELTPDPVVLDGVDVQTLRPYGTDSDLAALTIRDRCNSLASFRSGVALLRPGLPHRIFEVTFGGGSHEGRVAVALPQGGWLLVSSAEKRLARWTGRLDFYNPDNGLRNPEDEAKNLDGTLQLGLLVSRFSDAGQIEDSWWQFIPGALWVADVLVENPGSAVMVGNRNFAHLLGRFEIQ
jgi:CHAT domain-containing protein